MEGQDRINSSIRQPTGPLCHPKQFMTGISGLGAAAANQQKQRKVKKERRDEVDGAGC